MFRRRFVADTVLYPAGGPYIATLHHVLVYHVPAEPLAPDCSPVARSHSTSSSPPPSVPRPPLAAGWWGASRLRRCCRMEHAAHSTQHTASPTWLMELPHRGAGHHLSPPSRDPSCQLIPRRLPSPSTASVHFVYLDSPSAVRDARGWRNGRRPRVSSFNYYDDARRVLPPLTPVTLGPSSGPPTPAVIQCCLRAAPQHMRNRPSWPSAPLSVLPSTTATAYMTLPRKSTQQSCSSSAWHASFPVWPRVPGTC